MTSPRYRWALPPVWLILARVALPRGAAIHVRALIPADTEAQAVAYFSLSVLEESEGITTRQDIDVHAIVRQNEAATLAAMLVGKALDHAATRKERAP